MYLYIIVAFTYRSYGRTRKTRNSRMVEKTTQVIEIIVYSTEKYMIFLIYIYTYAVGGRNMKKKNIQ